MLYDTGITIFADDAAYFKSDEISDLLWQLELVSEPEFESWFSHCLHYQNCLLYQELNY